MDDKVNNSKNWKTNAGNARQNSSTEIKIWNKHLCSRDERHELIMNWKYKMKLIQKVKEDNVPSK